LPTLFGFRLLRFYSGYLFDQGFFNYRKALRKKYVFQLCILSIVILESAVNFGQINKLSYGANFSKTEVGEV
jgi:hypothetical protein